MSAAHATTRAAADEAAARGLRQTRWARYRFHLTDAPSEQQREAAEDYARVLGRDVADDLAVIGEVRQLKEAIANRENAEQTLQRIVLQLPAFEERRELAARHLHRAEHALRVARDRRRTMELALGRADAAVERLRELRDSQPELLGDWPR